MPDLKCDYSTHNSTEPRIYIASPFSTDFHNWSHAQRYPFWRSYSSLCPLCYIHLTGEPIRLRQRGKTAVFQGRSLEVWLDKLLPGLRSIRDPSLDVDFGAWKLWPAGWFRNSAREIGQLVFNETVRLARRHPTLIPADLSKGEIRSIYSVVTFLA